ncbi:MAG: DUF3147 family protein [Spirochaetota bacterium]|nr:DUF3147 family protein [Spirochaetota bacterium]
MYYVVKVAVSALVIVVVSEVAKRSSLIGALIAALPLTSLLAIVWMWAEKTDVGKIADLSSSIFWLVIPSLLFFVLFPMLLNRGVHFWMSFAVSAVSTIAMYLILAKLLHIFGIEL